MANNHEHQAEKVIFHGVPYYYISADEWEPGAGVLVDSLQKYADFVPGNAITSNGEVIQRGKMIGSVSDIIHLDEWVDLPEPSVEGMARMSGHMGDVGLPSTELEDLVKMKES